MHRLKDIKRTNVAWKTRSVSKCQPTIEQAFSMGEEELKRENERKSLFTLALVLGSIPFETMDDSCVRLLFELCGLSPSIPSAAYLRKGALENILKLHLSNMHDQIMRGVFLMMDESSTRSSHHCMVNVLTRFFSEQTNKIETVVIQSAKVKKADDAAQCLGLESQETVFSEFQLTMHPR